MADKGARAVRILFSGRGGTVVEPVDAPEHVGPATRRAVSAGAGTSDRSTDEERSSQGVQPSRASSLSPKSLSSAGRKDKVEVGSEYESMHEDLECGQGDFPRQDEPSVSAASSSKSVSRTLRTPETINTSHDDNDNDNDNANDTETVAETSVRPMPPRAISPRPRGRPSRTLRRRVPHSPHRIPSPNNSMAEPDVEVPTGSQMVENSAVREWVVVFIVVVLLLIMVAGGVWWTIWMPPEEPPEPEPAWWWFLLGRGWLW